MKKNIIKDLVNEGIGSMDQKKREDTLEFFEELYSRVNKIDPHWAVKNHLKAYEIIHGPHFNEEYADLVISNMENVDGTKGIHYSLSQAKELLEKYSPGVHSNFNVYDWWVILNMQRSDYYGVLGSKDEIYIALTQAYFNGPDEANGKAWYQFHHKLKGLLKQK